MSNLTLSFFGASKATLDGKTIPNFRSAKVQGLLVYLALMAQQAHARDALATLFWPDEPETVANHNLRQSLYRLRGLLGDEDSRPEPYLLVTRSTVQFNPASKVALDVTSFLSHLEKDQLESALALYQGDLLSGFSCDSLPFEEWLRTERERLHRLALNALFELTSHSLARAEYQRAQTLARQQLALEPWREEAHQQLMQALLLLGERSAALAQYEICRTVLAEELGIDPSADTSNLAKRIREAHPARATQHQLADIVTDSAPEIRSHQDWGEAPMIHNLYGREREVATLTQWLLHQGKSLIVLLGIGGVGKTTLAANIALKVTEHFDFVIWRSLLNAPPLGEILRDWLDLLSGHTVTNPDVTFDIQMRQLFAYLRKHRCLLILDNMESVLGSSHQPAERGAGHQEYIQLIQRMGASDHRSTLLITSRERPYGVGRLTEQTPSVEVMQLDGLTPDASQRLMAARGITEHHDLVKNLAAHYSGNPLALELVARTIHELFDSDIRAFISEEIPIFDDIRGVLDQQFSRLSTLERAIMFWLAIEREAVSMEAMNANFSHPPARRDLLEAFRMLQRRSLLLKNDAGFTLQNVVMEYSTDLFIQSIVQEFVEGAFVLLHRHVLIKATAREYVRGMQERLILHPIGQRLLARFGRTGIETTLSHTLTTVRADQYGALDYAGGNLLNLALHLKLTVNKFDFSKMPIVQAFLRDARLADVNFRQARFASTRFRDTFGINYTVAISANNEWLATGTSDYTVRIWKLATQETHGVLEGHTQAVWGVVFSPNGRLLASGSIDRTVRLWDVQTGQEICCFAGHTGAIRSLAFSPDGKTIASVAVSDDREIRLWDVEARTCYAVLHNGCEAQTIAFTPDGRFIVTGGADHRVHIWDLPGQQLWTTLVGHTSEVNSVAVSSDGAMVASGSSDHTIRLWQVTTQQPLMTFTGHTSWITRVVFLANDKLMASASADHTIRLWDVANGHCLRILREHSNIVLGLTASQDGQLMASTSEDQSVRVWDAVQGQTLFTLRGYNGAIGSLAYTHDGRNLITAGADCIIYGWDTETNAIIYELTEHRSLIRSIALSPNSQLLVSTDEGRAVCVWDLPNRKLIRHLQGHRDTIRTVQFSPDGNRVIGGGDDHHIYCWDVHRGEVKWRLDTHTQQIWSLAISADGRFLASVGLKATGLVLLWDLASREICHRLKTVCTENRTVQFHKEGEWVVVGSDDGAVQIFHTGSRQLIHTLNEHNSTVRTVAFDQQGVLLATAGYDRIIRVWDTVEKSYKYRLDGHTNAILALIFHPHEQLLVSCSIDESIKIWDLRDGHCLHTLRLERPYADMNIDGVIGLSQAQKMALLALGARES